MKIRYQIVRSEEGDLAELIECVKSRRDAKPHPTLDEVLASMADLAFLVETVAHLQGKESTMLPTADNARRIIAALKSVDTKSPTWTEVES